MKRSLLILGALAAFAPLRLNAAIPADQAVNAILGEAANQPYQSMLGIACAIRNRGSLKGVYGANNFTAQHCPAAIRARAARAWTQSAQHDITAGCRYFGCPADANYFLHTLHYHLVLKLGAITFYKP